MNCSNQRIFYKNVLIAAIRDFYVRRNAFEKRNGKTVQVSKIPKRSLCERVRLKKKGKTGFLIYALLVTALSCLSTPVFAEGGDPLAVVGNLSTFIFSLIRAIGLILLGWGVVQVGLSFQSHDPSQRSQGFLTLAGGLVITFAKEILDLITGG